MENQNKLQVGDVVKTKSKDLSYSELNGVLGEPYMTVWAILGEASKADCMYFNPLTCTYQNTTFFQSQLVKVETEE